MVALDSLGFVKGFVVAAFLARSDYGIWGILVISLGTLGLLKQFGVMDKYVQQSEADQERAFQRAFTLEVIFTGLFGLVVLAAIPLVALVYGQPEVIAPGLVLVLLVPAAALQMPIWIHYRRMDFVRQRSLQAIDPVVGFVVTVALAIAGAGYWSLVIGAVAGGWAAAAAAVATSPYPLAWRHDRGTLREYTRFSVPLLVAGGAGMLIAQASMLVGEAELGLVGAGAIALASSISIYAERVDGIVTQTLYPAICAVRDRTDLLYESFVKSNRLALMWGVPFGVAVALFASDLVAFGIGERWRPAVPLIQAFGLMAAANHVGFNWSAFYRARGETRPVAVVSVVTMAVYLAVAIPLLASDGLEGLAWGMGITTAVGLLGRAVYLVRLFPGFGMLAHAARAVAPTVPAVAAVLALRALGDLDRTLALSLLEIGLYLGVTAAATLALERRLLAEMAGYLRGRAAGARVAV